MAPSVLGILAHIGAKTDTNVPLLVEHERNMHNEYNSNHRATLPASPVQQFAAVQQQQSHQAKLFEISKVVQVGAQLLHNGESHTRRLQHIEGHQRGFLGKGAMKRRNLPPCTRQELSLLCFPYGRIPGSLVIDTYGYIQFNSLTEAKRAIESLNLFIFKSKALRVSNVSISSLKATFSGIARPNRRRIEWSDADEVILVERIKYDDDENNDDDDNDESDDDFLPKKETPT
ncbi:GD16465 [Drosophila simulans]|uniref:GD16465 n=1 Tax=Drosophila simulans TaxID=7240 RepID=B4R7G8_DROSI|nr:GD16465 [Drosophila simulans]